ncbi:fatty-acid amide hydrolase 2-A-like [Anoplophora glabripennis]|uniref:fatty-acid amide hydrolase 2-A-like n=1 Tax=Anoplophora glabripennis TaxID=217634 RepID=UPI0008753B95|nr:fatty-acid amide hydrolase 2-A-like [Anoplophora glabripennis]
MTEIKKQTRKNESICNKFKTVLLFISYYINIFIDKIFGYFYNSRRIQIHKCTNPIILSSAVSVARRIRKGELKSEEVVQAFINRIQEVNPILNAVVDDRFEEALEEARKIDKDIQIGNILDVDFQEKPFLGVPFTTKESTAVKGLSYTFGLIRRKNRKALFDADYVTLMKEAGGICLGVTNIPQLNLWQETSNPLFGITNNPYDTTRTVGGSSGGEASILAAGGTPIGIGTDIGGSNRIPAFMCGVFGHKPTSHLISTKGMTFRTGKEEQTMVVVGTLTKYVEDIIPLLKVLVAENICRLKLDQPVDVKKLKIYYIMDPKDPFVNQFRDEMKSTLASAVNYFTEISLQKPQELEFEGTKYTGKLWKYWMSKESDANFKKDIMNREGETNPAMEILKHFTVGGDYTTATIFNFVNCLLPYPNGEWATRETEKLRKQILEKLKDDGVLLYPSAPWPANYHHTALLRPWNFNLFAIWNVLKFPVTQVPMGLKNGLPVGIQVVAAPHQDHLCIAVAGELEKAFGGYVPPFQTS